MAKRTLQRSFVAMAILIVSVFQVSIASAADSNVNSLVKRLNAKSNLWQINTVASTQAGTQSQQRLGLYQKPTAVINCNIRFSGTWLFVYKSINQGYKAATSNYFVRTNAYDVEMLIDPKTDYVVLLHTSLGGNEQCLNSAYKVLSYITD